MTKRYRKSVFFIGVLFLLFIPTLIYREVNSSREDKQNILEEPREDGFTDKNKEDIVQALSQRKDILLEEIEKDPSAIKKYALSKEVKDNLSEEAKGLVEQEVKTDGKLTVLIADDFKNAKSKTSYKLESAKKYNVKFIEEPQNLKSSEQVTAKGLALGSTLVLDSGESPSLSINAPPRAGLTGAQNTLVIRFNWLNDTSEPFLASAIDTQLYSGAGSTNVFYQENSYNQLSFPGDTNNVTTSWYTLTSYNKGTGCSDPDITNWTLAANSAATTAGYVLGNYNNLIYLFPDNPSCGWAGLGEVGGTLTWINGYNDSSLYSHELGHNVGMGHASSKDCGTKTIDSYANCSNSEYGDGYDVMGGSWINYHFNAAFKNESGWILPGEIQTVSTNGTYTLNTLESADSATKAIKIQKADTGEYYWLEYRQATGFDSTLPSGVTRGLIVHVFNGVSGSNSYLLDMTPADGWSDVALSDGTTFTDGTNSIVITQANHSTSAVTLSINLPTLLGSYDNGGVYYIDNGQKRPIPTSSAFTNWGFNWGDVYWAPLSVVNSYSTGQPLTQLALNNNTVYLVQNNTFRPIFDSNTLNIFKDNWGIGWGDIYAINDTLLASKSQGATITFPSLVTYSYGGTVYYMDIDGKRPIQNAPTFTHWGFNWNQIFYTRNNAFLAGYPSPAPLSVLASNNGSVYLIENGSKRPIDSAQSFNNHASFDPVYDWNNIFWVSSQTLSSLPTGSTVY